ncbi:MAG: aldehyde dehydrogenase family protein [Actinobacteria bacterium]|nr:aldehyde dehydrogenase family protein [Actinomycetota bacterium]
MRVSIQRRMKSEEMPKAELLALTEPAIKLVRQWLKATPSTKAQLAAESRLSAILKDPNGLNFTLRFVDRVIRPEDNRICARELYRLAKSPPKALPPTDRAMIRLGGLVAPIAPGIVIPIAQARLRQLVAHLIADARDAQLTKHIASTRSDGTKLNLNLLGEAVLGEKAARERFEKTFELLKRDDVDYVSIKVSSVISQVSMWGFDATVERVIERLKPLYNYAASQPVQKFINLDMEEYRDLSLTLEVFQRLMSLPETKNLEAGIVLQAYLPDALGAMKTVQEFAAKRVASGGAPIKVRVVKGANLLMEKVDADLHGWVEATYPTKQATDTNYKRVLDWALTPEHTANVRIGVAGHNLFDIALAHLLAEKRGVSEHIDFEMLKGMAVDISATVRKSVGSLLLYTPVVHPKEFEVAIAYLTRRLEENASPENFMSGLFDIASSEDIFKRERDRFTASVFALDDKPQHARRVAEGQPEGMNMPDSDPALAETREWVAEAVAAAHKLAQHPAPLPNSIAKLESEGSIDQAVARARAASAAWAKNAAERERLLHLAARELQKRRTELATVMIAEAGKTIAEADTEISEAIDFANFYASRIADLSSRKHARFDPYRVTVVTPPWNFPLAIPAGGVLAALAAGSTAIIKPAPEVPRCSELMVEALWAAGIPRDVLQIVSVEDGPLGLHLVANDDVDNVVLTGAWETAKLFTDQKPGLHLMAETSGKNAMVITPNADLDLAAADLAKSAFGHAGQKCSAASLAILVGSVAKSKKFLEQLVDAAASMKVGLEADSSIGALVNPPGGKLLRALTTLEPGESWLLEPKQLDDEGYFWSPGIKLGIKPGSWFHLNECFGPVLGIMSAKNLKQAVEIQNGTDYGLTAGIQSLDPQEQRFWIENVIAGNKYINRGITGAIVKRQPFGGLKRSSVGPGFKAGGDYYLYGFGVWRDLGTGVDERKSPGGEESHPTLERNLHVFRPEVSSRGDYVWPHDDLKDEEFQALQNTREESISITNHRFGAPIKE